MSKVERKTLAILQARLNARLDMLAAATKVAELSEQMRYRYSAIPQAKSADNASTAQANARMIADQLLSDADDIRAEIEAYIDDIRRLDTK